ncbi:YceD family protein [Rhizosaccharibacter radicis]|uniref:DUF177 domain-containing protein n=1 Tax=Rhizosaccharibacter radicis TaxID=2782605 RepID=A0ABT1VYR4_9PROT|nr:DUF177 domain-containing protein [Acetobacteraceae bacterium KSS12]
MAPEMSRRIAVSRIQAAGEEIVVTADPAELPGLAKRLGIPAVDALSCRFRLQPPGPDGAVGADGLLDATVRQQCVVTLDDFTAPVRDAFTVRFVPAEALPEAGDAPVDPEEEDEIPFMGNMIDLGEAAVEQLALALDPYPRSPGALLAQGGGFAEDMVAEPEAGDGRPNPFAALKVLRDRTD